MIGVYDSGVGGLSVWRELDALMPDYDMAYYADAAHCPYGTKPLEYIVRRAEEVTHTLMEKYGAEMIVVACNTATAAAISYLRSHFPIPFVGMEPAIKPAALTSRTKVVGILATANTLRGSLYHNTLLRFASDVKVIQRVGEGLVELVEAGITEGEQVDRLLHLYLDDMLAEGADQIVLGCTHYPFLKEAIARIAGEGVQIIDPAPAVALQTRRVANENQIVPGGGSRIYYTSGDENKFKTFLDKFIL